MPRDRCSCVSLRLGNVKKWQTRLARDGCSPMYFLFVEFPLLFVEGMGDGVLTEGNLSIFHLSFLSVLVPQPLCLPPESCTRLSLKRAVAELSVEQKHGLW